MQRILRFLTFFVMFVVGTNAWSAGYICTESMTYTSCSNGYYVSNCGASSNWVGQTLDKSELVIGNACVSCPDGYADSYANANFKIDVLVADTWYTVFDTSSRAYNDYGSTVGAHMPKTFNILPMMSTVCPAGSYGNTSAVSGVIYSTINSSNVCTACAAGKYQDVQGQTSCKNCDSLLGIKAESAEGSASKEACYIPADKLADDGMGQYRYTNDCYYK